MDLLTLIVVLMLVGFCLWLAVTFVPMPEPYRRAMIAIVVILLILWIVSGLLGGLPTVRLR